MIAPICRCGCKASDHATAFDAWGTGRCFGHWVADPGHVQQCECRAFVPASVVLPRGTVDRCARCGTTHATTEALPWCAADGRKASDAS